MARFFDHTPPKKQNKNKNRKQKPLTKVWFSEGVWQGGSAPLSSALGLKRSLGNQEPPHFSVPSPWELLPGSVSSGSVFPCGVRGTISSFSSLHAAASDLRPIWGRLLTWAQESCWPSALPSPYRLMSPFPTQTIRYRVVFSCMKRAFTCTLLAVKIPFFVTSLVKDSDKGHLSEVFVRQVESGCSVCGGE